MPRHSQYIHLIEYNTDVLTHLSTYKFKCSKCKKTWDIIYNENIHIFIKGIHPAIFINESCIQIK